MTSRQVSVPYCNAFEPSEVFGPDTLTILILSMSKETKRSSRRAIGSLEQLTKREEQQGKKNVDDWWTAWDTSSTNHAPGEKQRRTVWYTRHKNAWKWVWLMTADCCHQPVRHCSKARSAVWQSAYPSCLPRLCSSRKSVGAKEAATEAAYFHSQGLFSVYPQPSPHPGAIFSS